MTDAQLLAQCRFEAFRGSGPGGQKRNKTSSAVRITHEPTSVSVVAGESRSQHQNKAMAIKRLRHRLAVEVRQPFDPERFELPPRLIDAPSTRRLEISQRDEHYPQIIGLVMDILSAVGWSVSDAAKILGVTTAHLVSFLHSDPELWAAVNRQRKQNGLRVLN